MIRKIGQAFVLDTAHTTYAFSILPGGHPEHLYYGRTIHIEHPDDLEILVEKHVFAPGNVNICEKEHAGFSLEDVRLEMSSYGKGDIREPFVEAILYDGAKTLDFRYEDAVITGKKDALDGLPGSYGSVGEVQQLCVTMVDRQYDLKLLLYYYVYEAADVIGRSAKIVNASSQDVQLTRLMSLQLDFDDSDYIFTTFRGAWAREMHRCDQTLTGGRIVNDSFTGTTSSRANSFVMLSRPKTGEDQGDCYGFHLIYSGNHCETAEVSSFGKLRLLTGINPREFSWKLEPGAQFQAPEAFMTYAPDGWGGMSRRMHAFIREHIVRGYWKNRPRPVLLNSWEACYFDISESRLLKLAKVGKDAGIELFVVDDGWFGKRNDDTSSLGDWVPNTKKLPGGLSRLAKKITDLGLAFGIWVEPEMVSVDSDLYRKHPDWTIEIPGKPHAEGRNQRILDLGRREVQEYIIASMTKVFSSAPVSYVKWDMNRTFSDYYSQSLPAAQQGEMAHRYVLGLYRCMEELTRRFPEILFEGCAAGGNRFDPGILCYFPQIWGSDDTDACCRADIQTNYSYGYPLSTVSAHVSACPNHQTLRRTPLTTRFAVAAFAVLGYECNFCDCTREELEEIRAQIALYRKWRSVLQQGTFYRGRTFADGNLTEWTCVSEDQTQAVGMLMQKLAEPNTQFHAYYPKGLAKEKRYHFTNRALTYSILEFGDLVNTVAPVHIRPDSVTHHLLAKFVKMGGETEDFCAYGDALMYGGVHLHPAFGGTGYNENVRYDESALFAGDLLRMYMRYAERRGWQVEIVSKNESDLGGYKEVICRVIGEGAYSQLKFESGGHRVQRVPATEAQGRIHTSACTVAVLPELDEVQQVEINPADLRIDVYRASGAGGQHVQKTDSAVRITHLPTGLVVECQDERSQRQNKDRAMAVLASRLYAAEVAKQEAQQASERKSLVGSGDRSERIRTYNYPQGRVTDHRINLTLYKLDAIMDGDLSDIITALTAEHQAELLASLGEH